MKPKPSSITYTFGKDVPIAALAGQTVTGGRPTSTHRGPGVVFETKIQGKSVTALLAGKPELKAICGAYEAEDRAIKAAAKAELLAAVPGLDEVRKANRLAEDAQEKAEESFRRYMDSGENTANPRAADPEFAATAAALRAEYPRAALYLRAERQKEAGDWSDSVGRRSAARKALKILRSGGSVEMAKKAISKRKEVDPWR